MTDMEMLSAYLDGELPAEVRTDVERRLASEPALAAALERLMQGDALLRQAVPLPSIDAARLARLGLAGNGRVDPSEPRAADNVVAIGKRPKAAIDGWPRHTGWGWMTGGALAASVALAVVLLRTTAPGDALEGDAAFQTAMSDLPSRMSAPVATGGQVSPVLTVPQRGGGYCREFELRGSAAAHGVACEDAGRWDVLALVADDAPATDDGKIVTAGGMTSADVDSVIADRRDGDPLSAEAEQILISGRWRNSATDME